LRGGDEALRDPCEPPAGPPPSPAGPPPSPAGPPGPPRPSPLAPPYAAYGLRSTYRSGLARCRGWSISAAREDKKARRSSLFALPAWGPSAQKPAAQRAAGPPARRRHEGGRPRRSSIRRLNARPDGRGWSCVIKGVRRSGKPTRGAGGEAAQGRLDAAGNRARNVAGADKRSCTGDRSASRVPVVHCQE